MDRPIGQQAPGVGAGIAGLTAARVLADYCDRVGSRTFKRYCYAAPHVTAGAVVPICRVIMPPVFP